MRKYLLTLWAFAYMVLSGGNFLSADLNRDGKPERLLWRKAGEDGMGTYYFLEVRDGSGKVVWRSTATMDPENPFFVAETDFGVSLPELLADIDGDGAPELIIPEPQSDVSPTRYHRLKWRNGRFEAMSTAYLAYFPAGGKGTVRWVHNFPEPFGRWVSEIKKGEIPGTAVASITICPHAATPEETEKEARFGVAVLRWAKKGGKILQWIEPLHPFGEEPETVNTKKGGKK